IRMGKRTIHETILGANQEGKHLIQKQPESFFKNDFGLFFCPNYFLRVIWVQIGCKLFKKSLFLV
ncbi:hypothetical protein ACO1GT_10150, partial [Staphylococcus arlettae]